ncbi:hypothetical protein [Terasakiella pusilla]|uniref:hypothetical protein n=1 Tax=Terasakiella pusilla TaxID=64973 RepID=UPI003AA9D2C7
MRVRQIIIRPKQQQDDTNWREDDMPPRHAPCYDKTRPIRNGWKWRSATAVDDQKKEYVLFANCAPKYNKWQAVLVLKTGNRNGSVIARYEYHGDHPGTHVHSCCDRSGLEIGSSGLGDLNRFPDAKSHHRRIEPLTENQFWEHAKAFFRVSEPKGPLL